MILYLNHRIRRTLHVSNLIFFAFFCTQSGFADGQLTVSAKVNEVLVTIGEWLPQSEKLATFALEEKALLTALMLRKMGVNYKVSLIYSSPVKFEYISAADLLDIHGKLHTVDLLASALTFVDEEREEKKMGVISFVPGAEIRYVNSEAEILPTYENDLSQILQSKRASNPEEVLGHAWNAWPTVDGERAVPSLAGPTSCISSPLVGMALKKISVLQLGNHPEEIEVRFNRMWAWANGLMRIGHTLQNCEFGPLSIERDYLEPMNSSIKIQETFFEKAKLSGQKASQFLRNLKGIFNPIESDILPDLITSVYCSSVKGEKGCPILTAL